MQAGMRHSDYDERYCSCQRIRGGCGRRAHTPLQRLSTARDYLQKGSPPGEPAPAESSVSSAMRNWSRLINENPLSSRSERQYGHLAYERHGPFARGRVDPARRHA